MPSMCATDDGADEEEAFVAVMDINDDDWWEIIDPETEGVRK